MTGPDYARDLLAAHDFPAAPKPENPAAALEVRNLRLGHSPGEDLVRDLAFTIARGEIVALSRTAMRRMRCIFMILATPRPALLEPFAFELGRAVVLLVEVDVLFQVSSSHAVSITAPLRFSHGYKI